MVNGTCKVEESETMLDVTECHNPSSNAFHCVRTLWMIVCGQGLHTKLSTRLDMILKFRFKLELSCDLKMDLQT